VKRELADGLVLRTSTPADAEAMAAFVGDVLRAQDSDEPNRQLAAWTRDLHEGRHPSFRPGDCTIVAEAATGAIVSCLHLVSQTWTYGGTPIGVGQPELIGTLPERRGRHLVRTQFDVVPGWSKERAHQLLVISGIPWFYRQFGYELTGRSADHAQRREIHVLERDGHPVGYVGHALELFSSGSLVVTQFEVTPGVSWREAWLAALAPLFEAGDAMAAKMPVGRCTALSFWLLGREHPLYRVFRFQEWDDPYAFYARVPDVASFLRAVTPALERRLAASACAGHSGSLTLGFYRDGVRLAFERGKVTAVESWRPDIAVRGLEFGRPSPDARRPLAMFPDLTFLQLMFGFRSLLEVEAAFPDCIVRTNDARALLDALFPRSPSDVWPLL